MGSPAVGMALVFEGALLLLAWALGAVLGAPPFATLTVDLGSALIGVLGTIPPLLGLLALLHARAPAVDRLIETTETVLGPLVVRATVFDIAIVSVLAGVAEEALFRGVLQHALAGPLGTWGAAIAAGVLFGLAHPVSALYAVLAALIGLYLGTIQIVTGNVFVAMVVHALYDAVALTVLVRRVRSRL